jgi:hypothetical protein
VVLGPFAPGTRSFDQTGHAPARGRSSRGWKPARCHAPVTCRSTLRSSVGTTSSMTIPAAMRTCTGGARTVEQDAAARDGAGNPGRVALVVRTRVRTLTAAS